VIAEDGNSRHAQRRQLTGEHPRLLRQAVIGEVPGEQHYLGGFGHLSEQRLKGPLRSLRAVDVSDRGDAYDSGHTRPTCIKS
jgi:hypothetical protein